MATSIVTKGMMRDEKWRHKIHHQILDKIDKEYGKLVHRFSKYWIDRATRYRYCIEFTDSLFRFMLIEFCLLKHNTSPMDTPTPTGTCMNTAFGMDTFPEYMMFPFEGPDAAKTSLPSLNFQGNFQGNFPENFNYMTYSSFLFLPELMPESRIALLKNVLHLCPPNRGYKRYVSFLHEIAEIRGPSRFQTLLRAALEQDKTMKEQKRSVVAALPEHAHMVNSKQLLPITLQQDMTLFLQDLRDDLNIDTKNPRQIMEERIRATLNDSNLTVQTKTNILQNLIDHPSSL